MVAGEVASLRVALVNQQYGMNGGLDRDCVLLARGLAANGIEVHVYCNPRERSVTDEQVVFHDVVPLKQDKGGRYGDAANFLAFASAATRAIRRDRHEYDIVHVSGQWAWTHDVVTMHAVSLAQQQRWLTQQGHFYRLPRTRVFLVPLLRPKASLLRLVERRQLARGSYSRLIARTDEVARDLQQIHGVPERAIRVIPYPLTVMPVEGAGSEERLRPPGLPSSGKLLLFMGHDFDRKGLREAIECLVHLPPSISLAVVGASDPAPFRELAESFGVAPRVHFVGGTDHPEAYYRAADVLVHVARQEPWGIPPIEAMAFELPVVTHEVVGSAVHVRAANAGIVLRSRRPAEIAQAVQRILDDERLRREFANRGAKYAQRFAPDQLARQTIACYEEICQERAAGQPRSRERIRSA